MVDFDRVIVGAGAVGCVLANRLSKDPDNWVFLLEYGGGDTNLMLYVPLGFYLTTSRSLASGAASPASRSPPGREGRGEQGQAERDDDRRARCRRCRPNRLHWR